MSKQINKKKITEGITIIAILVMITVLIAINLSSIILLVSAVATIVGAKIKSFNIGMSGVTGLLFLYFPQLLPLVMIASIVHTLVTKGIAGFFK